jgi:hypothetical protein
VGALEDALQGGPSEGSDLPAPPSAGSGDDDLEILYDEFKGAPDAKTAISALRQLVRGLK